MSVDNGKSLAKGVAAGVAGGLVASWIMNQFMAKAGGPLQRAIEGKDERDEEPNGQEMRANDSDDGAAKEDATMKTADALTAAITGGRHLSFEEKEKGGPIVHYAFGALMGGIYGALAEYSSTARAGFGTAFGGALFAGADLIAVPAFDLSGAPIDSPAASYATPFAAHVVYGLTTEFVRRIVRTAL